MVTSETPAKARNVATDTEIRVPEVSPFFYWVLSPRTTNKRNGNRT